MGSSQTWRRISLPIPPPQQQLRSETDTLSLLQFAGSRMGSTRRQGPAESPDNKGEENEDGKHNSGDATEDRRKTNQVVTVPPLELKGLGMNVCGGSEEEAAGCHVQKKEGTAYMFSLGQQVVDIMRFFI